MTNLKPPCSRCSRRRICKYCDSVMELIAKNDDLSKVLNLPKDTFSIRCDEYRQ